MSSATMTLTCASILWPELALVTQHHEFAISWPFPYLDHRTPRIYYSYIFLYPFLTPNPLEHHGDWTPSKLL